MSKLSKNYLYNISYQVFILIVPLITAPYLTRVLGAVNLGIQSYVNSYASIITTVTSLGIYNYGIKQLASVKDERDVFNSTFWELFLLRIIFAIFGSLLYFSICKEQFLGYLIIYYPWVLSSYLDVSWVFISTEDMHLTVIKNFFTKTISIIGIFLFVKDENCLNKYLLILAISTLISNLSLFPQLKKYIRSPVIRIHRFLFHIQGCISYFLPQVASLLYLQIDKVMLEALTGNLSQISFYDQAEKIVKLPLTFITVSSTVLLPRISYEYSRGNNEIIKNFIHKSINFALLLAFPMMIGLIVIAPNFIPWYLGEEYTPTSIGICILSPLILSSALSGISGSQYFSAIGQMKIVTISNVAALIFNLILNLFLIRWFGFIGACISSVLANYLIIFVQYNKFKNYFNLRDLFRYLPRYFLNSLIMGIVVYICTNLLRISFISTVLEIAIGILVYLLLLIIENDSLIWEMLKLKKWKKRKL